MIKCKTKNGNTRIKMKGTMADISADALMILKAIKDSLNEDCAGDGDAVMGDLCSMITDPDGPLADREHFIAMEDVLNQLKNQNGAMTAALREHVDADHLCLLCRHYDQCQAEGENEDDKTTRFWRCKAGEEFEFKEVE